MAWPGNLAPRDTRCALSWDLEFTPPAAIAEIYLRLAHELARSRGQLVVRQDLYAQSCFYYSNFAASVNVPANGIGPLDPNTRIGGYTILNARVDWNNIAGSKVHAAAYVRNMLNEQYEVGGVGLGATVGLDAVMLGTPRLAAWRSESGFGMTPSRPRGRRRLLHSTPRAVT